MADTLSITSADLTPDFDDNEVKITLSDGTEVFMSLRAAKPGRGPMLSISTGLGRTIADLDLGTFRRESQ